MVPVRPFLALALLLALHTTSLAAQTADLSLTVEPIGPAIAPWPTRFEMTVVNEGPARATNVRMESPHVLDPLSPEANPNCASVDEGTVRFRCTVAALEPGQRIVFAGNIGPAPEVQPATFVFHVRADENDPDLSDNDAAVTIDWVDADDAEIKIIPPDLFSATRVARVQVTNRSDWSMDDATVTLNVFNRVAVVSTSPSTTCRDVTPEGAHDFTALQCAMPSVPPHSTRELAVELTMEKQTSTHFHVNLQWWPYLWEDRATAEFFLPFTVTTTGDAGAGSLRQAILDANARCVDVTDACRIVFAIDATPSNGGWYTIRPLTPLPAITAGWLTIDGFTQHAKSGDTNPLGPEIELDGTALTAGDALVLYSQTSGVRGLAIGGFPGHGVLIEREHDGQRDLVFEHVITDNYIGVDPTGARANANGGRGIFVRRGRGTVERNVLSGNARSGAFFDALGAVVRDNRVGVAAHDDTAIPNGASGIFVGTRVVGYGSALVEGNTIAHNGHFGVALSPGAWTVVTKNHIYGNTQGGIDVGLDGPTPESSVYTIAPAPVVVSARFDGRVTTIEGRATSLPGNVTVKARSVEVYANGEVGWEGYAEGEALVGVAEVEADGTFRLEAPGDLRGRWISAVGLYDLTFYFEYTLQSSSEFSRPVRVTD